MKSCQTLHINSAGDRGKEGEAKLSLNSLHFALELSIISNQRAKPQPFHLVSLRLSWWVVLSQLPRQLLLKLINEGCIVFITLNMLSTVLLMLSGRRNSSSSSCRESLKYPRGPRSRCEWSNFPCLLTYIQKIKMNIFCFRSSWG